MTGNAQQSAGSTWDAAKGKAAEAGNRMGEAGQELKHRTQEAGTEARHRANEATR